MSFAFRPFSLAFLIVLLSVPAALASVPAAPVVHQLTQPDGSTISVQQEGSRQRHWFRTVDGYAVVQESDGWWHYADRSAGGSLVASGLRVGVDDLTARRQMATGLAPLADNGAPADRYVPRRVLPPGRAASVNQPVLVIVASFNDISTTYSDASFASLIFGATDSVKDYYDEASYGDFAIVPADETEGVANDGVIAVSLGMDHPNPAGGDSSAIVVAALAAADPSIDYSAYDSNADGDISVEELSIIIITAGYEASYSGASPSVWGHKSGVSPQTLDGVDLSPYCMFGERHGGHQATIGIMVHELGHLMLGLPDLYDISAANGDSEGVGNWGVMGGGSWLGDSESGDTPSHFLGWSKIMVGFAEATDVVTGEDLVVEPSHSTASLKRIWTDPYKLSTYFLLEARDTLGFDSELPGSGLLITHIDNGQTGNQDETHKLVDIEAADGLNHLDDEVNRGDAGDPFPGTSSNTVFDNASSPDSKRYDGSASGVTVDDITTLAAGVMSVDVASSALAGDHIRYDQAYSGAGRGWASNELWTAERFTNDTEMNTLDGVEVLFYDYNETGYTIDLYIYESIPGGLPTNLLYSEANFTIGSGISRLMLATPQAFPADSDLVVVLSVEGDNPAINTWARHDATGASSSGRSYHDSNGIGTFSSLAAHGDLHQRALLSSTAEDVLTVTLAGNGSGTVTSDPAGIDCGADCSEAYDALENVTLTAVAGVGSAFAGWTGDAQCVSANAETTVSVDGFVDCTATFVLQQRTLTVATSGAGSGSVTSDAPGIDCPGDCSEDYDYNTAVTLTAVAESGSIVSGWSGDCSGTNAEVQVTLDEARSCSVEFGIAPEMASLSINFKGDGGGEVFSLDANIDCGNACVDAAVVSGSEATLVASPDPGSVFVGWSGDCSGAAAEITVTVAGEMTCTAGFYVPVFADGLEGGDLCEWSGAVGGICDSRRAMTTPDR